MSRWAWVLLVVMAAAPVTVRATGLDDALAGGKPALDARLRHETVDQDSGLRDAHATTLRVRLGYATGNGFGFDAFGEFESVTVLGPETYNSGPGGNGQVTRAVVGDPDGSELNQAWLRFSGWADTAFQAGRQRLVLDNARFIGNSGWRQNELTYDGLVVSSRVLPQTTVTAAQLINANTPGFANLEMNSQILHAAWSPGTLMNFSVYGYWLDFDSNTSTRADTRSYGLRAGGAWDWLATRLSYAAEYAHQGGQEEAPDTVNANYGMAEAGLRAHGVNARLGYEILGGNGVYAFQTPLATLHAFNGWADQFLTTPATGLHDAWLSLGATVAGMEAVVAYHDFRADAGSAHYGAELDAQLGRAFGPHARLLLKVADYQAKSFSTDTAKTWLQVEYRF